MIDVTILPREGLFDRTFSVLAEIRHPNNSTKLADINSIMPASSKRLTEKKKLYLNWTMLQAQFTIQTGAENDLVVRHFEYFESNLDCMGVDKLLVCTC